MDSSGSGSESDRGNKSSASKVSRSYPPLSLYMNSSAVKKKHIPLSRYNTTLVYHHAPGESNMDIFVTEEKKVVRRNNDHHHPDPRVMKKRRYLDPLWFYMDRTVSHHGLRINYIQLSSSISMAASTAVSKFSESKYESNVSLPFQSSGGLKIIFGSFESKVSKKSSSIIPDKVAFSILSKLSIKSLRRFGCVRKSWSNLFENTDFMTIYSKHFISRHGSDDDGYHTFLLGNCYQNDDDDYYYLPEFYFIGNKLTPELPSPILHFDGKTCILGSTSVNGIFCFGLSNITPRFIQVQYVLWNPCTEEFMVIPSSPAQLTQHFPKTNIHHYMRYVLHGFGYDQLRDHLKLIHYVYFDYTDGDYSCRFEPTKSFLEIYSLKSNSWTMIHMGDDQGPWGYLQTKPFGGHEVYLDGACHWLAVEDVNLPAVTLLSFDLSDEVFLTTPIGEEPCFSPYSYHMCLTVLNGSIALISNHHDDVVFNIFILGELGVSESWIKLYTYGPLPSIQWPPIGFGKMGYIFVAKKYYEVAYVDLSTQVIEEVGITSGYGTYFIGGLYKESLLSIGGSDN